MKQRITYIQPEGTFIDRDSIHVNPDSVVYTNAGSAALEKRLTLGLDDLPPEVAKVLEQCHEVRIRWAAPADHAIPAPFVSRVPSGLHVFFTPLKSGEEVNICPLIQTLFGKELKCHSTLESFSRPPLRSETFASAASYQYFHVLPNLSAFREYVHENACRSDLKARLACEDEAQFAEYAASVDIDFDTISRAVNIAATWSADVDSGERPGSGITNRAIVKFRENHRYEVGILQSEKADEIEELSLGGYLAVLGENDSPSATMFSFPSRHHPLPAAHSKQSFAAAFQHPTGLHPKLDLTFPAASLKPPQPSCALHAYLTLPSALFIDRYQFSDGLFLESQNLKALHALSGEQDLEAPDWIIKSWGSAALFELSYPDAAGSGSELWTATIPTHLRYVSPANSSASSSSHASLDIPAPIVFWACHADDGPKFKVNPFDRENLGYDGLFGTKTMFYHVPPAPVTGDDTISGEEGKGLLLNLDVPVLDSKGAGWVPTATMAVVLVGFAWVLFKLVGGGGKGEAAEKRAKKE